jgi:hypothetical protein
MIKLKDKSFKIKLQKYETYNKGGKWQRTNALITITKYYFYIVICRTNKRRKINEKRKSVFSNDAAWKQSTLFCFTELKVIIVLTKQIIKSDLFFKFSIFLSSLFAFFNICNDKIDKRHQRQFFANTILLRKIVI